MAVASEQNNTVSVQNLVEIVFVDEDDFPLANLMEHMQSDDDLDNDFELVQDEEEADTPNRTLPVPCGRRNENTEWSRYINLCPDLDFDQPTGPRIELQEDMKPVDFFQLYFTDALWNHIVDQTNLYAEQKRGPEERSVWYVLTVNELKAWIELKAWCKQTLAENLLWALWKHFLTRAISSTWTTTTHQCHCLKTSRGMAH